MFSESVSNLRFCPAAKPSFCRFSRWLHVHLHTVYVYGVRVWAVSWMDVKGNFVSKHCVCAVFHRMFTFLPICEYKPLQISRDLKEISLRNVFIWSIPFIGFLIKGHLAQTLHPCPISPRAVGHPVPDRSSRAKRWAFGFIQLYICFQICNATYLSHSWRSELNGTGSSFSLSVFYWSCNMDYSCITHRKNREACCFT